MLLIVGDVMVLLSIAAHQADEHKEPYGPACRDYFWLMCHLTDNVSRDDAVASWENEGNDLDLNALTQHVADSIKQRGFLVTT